MGKIKRQIGTQLSRLHNCRGVLGFFSIGVATALATLASSVPAALATQPIQEEAGLPASSGSHTVAGTAQQEPIAEQSRGEPSEAEQIAGLGRTIEAEEKRLKELEAELSGPNGEYAKAEREFREVDDELEAKRQRLQQLKQQGKTSDATLLEKEVKSLERQWSLAKERFELAIEERKTLREEVTTLKLKVQKDREALEALNGMEDSAKTEGDKAPDRDKHEESSEKDKAEGTSKTAGKAMTLLNLGDSEQANETSLDKASEGSDEPVDEELMQAEAEAKQKEEEAAEAQEDVQSIAARMTDLQKIIVSEQKILALTRKKADLALKTQRALEEELARRLTEQASAEELQQLRSGITEAKGRYDEARAEVTESTDRLTECRSELAALQSQQIVALQEADKKRLEAEAAKEKVEGLRNPFAPRNILQWVIDHGPRLFLIIFGMVLLDQLAKFFGHRTIKLIAGGTGRGTTIERENRAKTLVGVFQNAVSVAIFVAGVLMSLEEMGANITVLMGGVAVVGLAVAFGAQNLIKDYFYGFVMLMENQYMLNDVVKIGELAGQVERITLRMTVLRDANGIVHFIPNGQINSVSNETHGWSRAAFEIGVAYKENVDRVMSVLAEMAGQMRHDPDFSPMILEDPTPPGVEELGESAVVIKFFIKTRPNQQRAVKRELLRRIKNRFDELAIELPFPHRTVFHRYEVTTPPAEATAMKKCA